MAKDKKHNKIEWFEKLRLNSWEVEILIVGFVYVWAKGDLEWVKMNVRYGKGRYANLKTKGENA